MELNITEAEIIETMQWAVDNILIPKFNELGYQGESLNATGEWLRELNVRAEGSTGIINGRKYTEQLVYGRRANKDKSTQGKIKWAVGMAKANPEYNAWLDARGLQQYAIQIAYSIADKGTRIYKEGGTDLLEVLQTPENIKRITEHLQGKYTPRVTAYIERQIKQAFA